MHKIILLICILCAFTLDVLAQPAADGIISGKVVDQATSNPLDYVSVKLFSSKDSSIVSGIYTDLEGKFLLEKIPQGIYFMKFTFIGYEQLSSESLTISTALRVLNAGTFKLSPEKQGELKEVKVTGQLDVLKAGIDKKIFNVGEDLTAKGGTANDVLSKIPSVELDQDGNVMLRGDGKVTILIDGRPSSLSGGNGKTLLDALPAGSIERIEVVNNPSAKYDPDGTSGIINIVLKKNKLRGFNGLINGNMGSGFVKNGNVFDGNASLSYRNSIFNLYGSYAGRYLDGYRNNFSTIDRVNSNDSVVSLKQDRYGTDQNFGHTFKFGIDLSLKHRQTLGISATGSVGERNRTGDQINMQTNSVTPDYLRWKRLSDDPSQQQNLDVNLNYRYDFKEDRGNIVADFNQSFGSDQIQGYYDQIFLDQNDDTINKAVLYQRLNNLETNNVLTGQLDLTYLYPKFNGRMEAGTKAILRDQLVNTFSESMDTVTKIYEQDTLSNFKYGYKEQIYSFYGIFGQQIKKFKYQVGVRAEQAYQIPNLISDTNEIVNDYFNVFPSGHIRYALTEKSEFSLSYSRRINRATSAMLNPFTSYADPYNLMRGNPYVKPEYIDSYDLGYMMEKPKVTLTSSVYYRHSTGMIMRIREYTATTSATTYANIDQSHSIGAELVFVYKPFKWFRNTFSANGNYIRYVDDYAAANWNVTGFIWNCKYNGVIDFWNKTASIQVSAAYNAPRVSVQGRVQRKAPTDVAFDKSFKNGTWSLGCRVSDIFNVQGFYLDLDQPSVQQQMTYKWLTRRFYVTFSYKFGKLEMTNKKSTQGEGGFDM
jgi:outer membrane receptor protein involved in Fe transport